jgi:arylsulfatase A
MKRREFLTRVGAGVLASMRHGAVNALAQRVPQRRPNIILIMADDLGYECLGCYGSVSYKTPELDKLAKTGMRFDHAYAQPLCTPSRVKLMTGRCNFRNYVAFGVLDPGETTFAHMLQHAGYATCVAGKWQLYGRKPGWVGAGTYPDRAGFDDYCLWQIEERESRYADPLIKRKGAPLHVFKGAYGPDVFCDYITEFMERNRHRPFLVYYPMCLVHDPFVPTPDSEAWREDRTAQNVKYFADMVAYMDKVVGRIVRKVDELGLRDNTLILFTGDNGTSVKIVSEMVGGRTIHGGKGHTTDAGTHVPLIANWQSVVPPGSVCDDLISFDDFLPTLAELTGAPLPRNVMIDGRSFAPQLRGEKGNPREYILCHYDPRHGRWARTRFARNKRWKLYDDGRLFDVGADPLEQTPVLPDQGGAAADAARTLLQQALNSMP